MLADQFLAAAAGVRTTTAADEIARKLWRAYDEGQIPDVDVEAISGAIAARRAVLAGQGDAPAVLPALIIATALFMENMDGTVTSLRASCAAREKMFGMGRPRALDRNAKVRIMHWARCLSRRTEKGRAYGEITAKALRRMEPRHHGGLSALVPA